MKIIAMYVLYFTICMSISGVTPRFSTAYGSISKHRSISEESYFEMCCSEDFFIRAFALANLFSIYALLSQWTSVMIPGESQFNSDGWISMNLGIGRMNPTLKLSFEISLSLMVLRLGCVYGGYSFLSFSLKSGITFLTALFFDWETCDNQKVYFRQIGNKLFSDFF